MMGNTISVQINKKERELQEGLSVSELLLSLDNPKAAVWINGKQLLRAEYDSRILMPGDEIKVLRITAGG